ncbi:MAG: transporter substrate-binding domain-containing protein [Acidobacteriota bacterium]
MRDCDSEHRHGPTVLALTVLLALFSVQAEAQGSSRLDAILKRGFIRVGTTGDYRPFTYFTPAGAYEGFDIDAAEKLGKALGVEVRFVKTTWNELSEGILEDRYDIAMSGITRTLSRLTRVGLTDSYLKIGKSALIRAADKGRFRTLADIDQPEVRIGVNPGGTNESFLRANIQRAQIVVIPDNLAIPDALATGKVDVMVTDNIEAILVAQERPDLFAVAPDRTFTKEDVAYMVPRDDQPFINWLNLWIHRMKVTGEIQALKENWIGK